MAPIGEHLYRITLEVGKQLNANMVNFKFFHQNGFGSGGEFTPRGTYRISLVNRTFTISNTTTEKGNVQLRRGAKISDGQKFVFTLDTSNTSTSVLTIEDFETGISSTCEIPTLPSVFYDLQGRRIIQPRSGSIYIAPTKSGEWRKVL